jgi:outer membrane protein OmpA-like peptidoglycan-associated protein
MKRSTLIAAFTAAVCAAGAVPALAHGWHGGHRHFVPRVVPHWRGPVVDYPYAYYPAYPVYTPPPPVIVERIYEAPPRQEPPVIQRRYGENEPMEFAQGTPPARPTPTLERYTLSAKELFGFDEATIRGRNAKLDEIAEVMKRNPAIDSVRITGYTDRIGSDSYNLGLSQRRAQAVKAYLVARGVEARRLQAIGKGKADPVVECHDKDRAALIRCLEPNRRVEVERIVVERTR